MYGRAMGVLIVSRGGRFTAVFVESLAEFLVVSAVQVQVLRAGYDVGPRVRGGAVDAPEAKVHAKLTGCALDLHVLQRPERHHGEVGNAAVAWIQDVELHTVEVDANAAGIAVVRGDLWREQESRGHERHAGDRRQKIAERHGSR